MTWKITLLFWVHNSKDVSWASLNVSMCLDNGHLGERDKWPLREVWSVQSKTTLSSNLCRGKKPSKPKVLLNWPQGFENEIGQKKIMLASIHFFHFVPLLYKPWLNTDLRRGFLNPPFVPSPSGLIYFKHCVQGGGGLNGGGGLIWGGRAYLI